MISKRHWPITTNFHANLSNLNKRFFSEIIKVDYNKIMSKETNLNEEIHNAFGRDGLGLLVIKNIPNYPEKREKILKKGLDLSQLSEEKLLALEKPKANYHVGWGKGKSYTENDYEYLCSHFYSRSTVDGLKCKDDPELEENYKNIWPKENDVPGFKNSFIEMGTLMTNVQINMLPHLDKYLQKVFMGYSGSTFTSFSHSHDSVSRLIIYHPSNSLPKEVLQSSKGESAKKNWAGWHRDFGLLTVLTHPMYFTFNEKNNNLCKIGSNKIKSGLLVEDRKNKIHDIVFSEDEVALQTGDASFILSGGNLIATPHAVKITSGIPENVYRVTMVNFFEPHYDYIMNLPENTTQREIFEKDPFNLTNMLTKFKQDCTYKDFIFTALNTYFPKDRT